MLAHVEEHAKEVHLYLLYKYPFVFNQNLDLLSCRRTHFCMSLKKPSYLSQKNKTKKKNKQTKTKNKNEKTYLSLLEKDHFVSARNTLCFVSHRKTLTHFIAHWILNLSPTLTEKKKQQQQTNKPLFFSSRAFNSYHCKTTQKLFAALWPFYLSLKD